VFTHIVDGHRSIDVIHIDVNRLIHIDVNRFIHIDVNRFRWTSIDGRSTMCGQTFRSYLPKSEERRKIGYKKDGIGESQPYRKRTLSV
jgi:hypothetical protein